MGYPAPVIDGACGRCLSGETRYDFGRAALELSAELRELIHHFKYNDRVSLARPLGRALQACLDDGGFEADFTVPVPLHPKRQRQRGYNQAELLARRLDMPCNSKIVRRRVDTESQTGLSRNQRALNVRSAFECRGPVDGAVLIVDDVQTTGATINEVTRVLKKKGARRIEVLTLARVGVSNQELATRTDAGSRDSIVQ
jgi:ComF family protein